MIHHTDACPSVVLPLGEIQEGNDGCLLVLRRVLGDDTLGALLVLCIELERDLC
jgi:hypothetical protein